jgi:hypothetical protein
MSSTIITTTNNNIIYYRLIELIERIIKPLILPFFILEVKHNFKISKTAIVNKII